MVPRGAVLGAGGKGGISFKLAELQDRTFACSPRLSALLKKIVFSLGGELLPMQLQSETCCSALLSIRLHVEAVGLQGGGMLSGQ